MKTLFIAIAAIAAVSSTSLASDSVDLRDSDTFFGKFSAKHMASDNATSSVEAFAVVGNDQQMTAFERISKLSEENDHGRK